MYCPGTTYVGRLRDELGAIAYAFCDTCRTIRVDARDGRGSAWRITYLDPAIL